MLGFECALVINTMAGLLPNHTLKAIRNIEDWVKMLRSLNPQSNNVVIFGAFQVMNDWNTF